MIFWLKLIAWIAWIAMLPIGIAIAFGLGIGLGFEWMLSVPAVVLFSLSFQGLFGMLLFGKEGRQFW
jgi:hypothetical protein